MQNDATMHLLEYFPNVDNGLDRGLHIYSPPCHAGRRTSQDRLGKGYTLSHSSVSSQFSTFVTLCSLNP